jgi:beta-N-acetylhexosaminidase
VTTARARRQAGARLVRSFTGLSPTPAITAALGAGRGAGVGLYRAQNVASPTQLRSLTAALQAARPSDAPPLIVALDQEGGQLQAFGDGATAWPGNLALGATGSVTLARRTGEAIGRELAAVGVNVVWAPVCDLLVDGNVAMGTRPFGGEPAAAGRMAAAMVRGLQSVGVAATIKHLPGHGSARADPHYDLPVIEASADEIRRRDLVPFVAALRARPRLAMVAHLAVPSLIGDRSTPTTFSPAIVTRLLRDELGFRGVSVSDALNMGALGHAEAAADHAVRAALAGFDLLLLLHEPEVEERAADAVLAAIASGRLDPQRAREAAGRVFGLRRWLGRMATRQASPSLEVVGSAAHLALAREIAERSITLVRDRAHLLPLRPGDAPPVLVLAPKPVDLTPADTSSYLRFGLAEALRTRGMAAESREMPLDPRPGDLVGLRAAATGRTVIVATIDATRHDGQAALVRALVADGITVVTIALRTPFDLDAYPAAGTHVCSYGIQPPTIEALADSLVARIPFRGRLPVQLPAEASAA